MTLGHLLDPAKLQLPICKVETIFSHRLVQRIKLDYCAWYVEILEEAVFVIDASSHVVQ